MRFSLIPRQMKFYDLFERGTHNALLAAQLLVDMMNSYDHPEERSARITDLENQGDSITHEIMSELHRTFVTPLDRDDIATLAHVIDDIVDFIEGAAYTMVLYKVDGPTDKSRQLAHLIFKSVEEVDKAVSLLRHPGQLRKILDHVIEINRLENEADSVLRLALVELFDNHTDPRDIIKWREIYELLETATDRCEDVGDVLEGVVLEHA